jgi:uncharacterized membrane protein
MKYFYLVQQNDPTMSTHLLILRIIHIVSATFWAGGVFTLAMFILPSINNTQPEGGKVMQKMLFTYRFPQYMTIASLLTILSGLWLYHDLSKGFQMIWIKSPQGITLTIGGLSAILAFLHGFTSNKPKATRMGKIGREIIEAGGKPTEAQLAEIAKLRKALTTGANIVAILILITVICMAAAQYVN